MVESLQELNKIVQKPDYKTQGNWMVRHILRDAALPITWLLLHTPVTANQVTLGSLAVGLLGVCLLAFPGAGFFLTACLLLQLWYLLDHVDGQIARYRGASGITGRFFDFVMHHVLHGTFFFSLGFYGYNRFHHVAFILIGFLGSLSAIVFNLMHDVKCKAFVEKIMQHASLRVKRGEKEPRERETGIRRRVFSQLHKLAEFHVVMNIFTGFALVQSFSGSAWDARFGLLIFHGALNPVLPVAKIIYWIVNKAPDREFEDTFQTS